MFINLTVPFIVLFDQHCDQNGHTYNSKPIYAIFSFELILRVYGQKSRATPLSLKNVISDRISDDIPPAEP